MPRGATLGLFSKENRRGLVILARKGVCWRGVGLLLRFKEEAKTWARQGHSHGHGGDLGGGLWQAPRTHCSLCSSQAQVPERRFPRGSALVVSLPLSHQTGLGDKGGAAKSGLLQKGWAPRGQPGPGQLRLAQKPRSRERRSAGCAESTPLAKVTPPLETECSGPGPKGATYSLEGSDKRG